MRNRAYRSTAVKQIVLAEVISRLAEGPLICGLDVGKETVLCVVRDSKGYFERPWKVKNPDEIPDLIEHLRTLAQTRPVQVALESTGTYGDALRQAFGDVGLEVRRVSGKAASDYAEIFDGVPSAHDGKDAAVVAELAALGKSAAWPLLSVPAWQAQMKVEVTWLDTQQEILQMWGGQLEALLARHWPEVTKFFALSSSTLLKMLKHYGGPAALAADDQGIERLTRWGGRFLKTEKIQAVFNSAGKTVGVRQNEATSDLVQRIAQEALDAKAALRATRRRLKELAKNDPVIQAQAPVVGELTACVLRVSVGDPRDYSCGAAYRKAMGLNLKERSSGKYQGQLKITKRGSSRARRWLYFAGLRAIQKSPLKSWYAAKKLNDKQRGKVAVVAVMRKLALALYAVATRDEPFSPERLLSKPSKVKSRKQASSGKQEAKRSQPRTKGSSLKTGLSLSAKHEMSVGGAAK